MYQRGVSVEQIARLNQREPAHVLQYLVGEHGRAPELYQNRPRRELVYDRPRPRPETWPDRDQRFKTMLARLEAFLSEHGRRPYRGDFSTTEGRLAHWLKVQRSKDMSAALLGHRARWLTEVLPDWRTDTRSLHLEAQWRLTLAQIIAFRAEHGDLPRRTTNPTEKFMGRWLHRQRDQSRHGTLEPDRRAALDAQLPGWN
ncbi:MAG: hypothetical protein MOP51_3020 [Citricoccus sp.]|nr:hypothetical protein [Citricoccus sp. WCRC_4]